MFSVFRLISLRHLTSRPARALLTTFGVALGVALYLAIDIINGSTLSFFRESVLSVAGKASLTVAGDDTGFPEEKVDVIKAVRGVAHAVPRVEARVFFTPKGGGGSQTLVVLGIDLLKESTVRTYKTEGEQVIDDPLVFLNQPDSIILTRSFATEHGFKLDDPVELLTAYGNKTFTVRGLLSPSGAAKAFGGGIAIMDIDGARVMFAKEGKVDRVDIVAAEGESPDDVGRRVEAALGPGYQVERPETQAGAFERMVQSYQAVLTFLSSLALLVGVFLVANSVSMAVNERRREIGILRAVGAKRSTILLAFVGEAAVMGVVGGSVGIVLGRAVARSLVGMVSRSMSTQYLTPIEISKLEFSASYAARAVAAGVLTAVLAALWPAYRATRIAGVEALRAKEAEPSVQVGRGAQIRYLVGAAMLAWLLVASMLRLEGPVVEALGPVCAVGGALLAAPALVTWLLGVIRRGVAPDGPLGRAIVLRLANDNLLRSPKRTASNVMTMMTGLLLVIVIASVHASFREGLGGWFDRVLKSDLLISSTGRLVSLQVQPLHEDLAKEIDAIPGVSHTGGRGAAALRYIQVRFRGATVGLKALDPPPPETNNAAFEMVDGERHEAARALFASATPSALVSENFARRFGVKRGDAIELDSPTGSRRLIVAGVVVDFASPVGVVTLSRDLFKSYWHDPLVTSFGVQVARGESPDVVRRRIEAKLGPSRGVVVTSNAELRTELGNVIDESFAYTRAIELAALAVGLLGLLNTALVSVMERSRELGMLRAVGMSRGQLARMILGESALQGTLGGIVAAALGGYVSYAWVVGSLSHALGWVIPFRMPWAAVLLSIGAGLAVGALAGGFSARRASGIQIREALDYE